MNKMTDILTDSGSRAFADSKLDMAIPFNKNSELGEIMERINELTKELSELTEKANQPYICTRICYYLYQFCS